MRYAMSGHQFTPLVPHPETGIRMAARYGYHEIEPFQNDVVSTSNVRRMSSRRCSTKPESPCAPSAAAGSTSIARDCRKRSTTTGSTARYIAQFGCRHIKVNLNRRAGPADLTAADAKARRQPERSRQADGGRRIRLAVHPHAWSIVERKRELEMMLEMTDPGLVSIVLDTAMPPSAASTRCSACETTIRIASIPLKDTLPRWNPAAGWTGPAPTQEEHRKESIYRRLGTGGVDFPAFFASFASVSTPAG